MILGRWYRVKHSPFWSVRKGDLGYCIEVRYAGTELETWCLRMKKDGKEHWFRPPRAQLEPVDE